MLLNSWRVLTTLKVMDMLFYIYKCVCTYVYKANSQLSRAKGKWVLG